MYLTGMRLKSTTSFITYIVRDYCEVQDMIGMFNTETKDKIYMVLSRVRRGMKTGTFEEVKPKGE